MEKYLILQKKEILVIFATELNHKDISFGEINKITEIECIN